MYAYIYIYHIAHTDSATESINARFAFMGQGEATLTTNGIELAGRVSVDLYPPPTAWTRRARTSLTELS